MLDPKGFRVLDTAEHITLRTFSSLEYIKIGRTYSQEYTLMYLHGCSAYSSGFEGPVHSEWAESWGCLLVPEVSLSC